MSINVEDVDEESVLSPDDALEVGKPSEQQPTLRRMLKDTDRRARLESIKHSEDARSFNMLLQFEMMNASLKDLRPSLSSQLRHQSAADSSMTKLRYAGVQPQP